MSARAAFQAHGQPTMPADDDGPAMTRFSIAPTAQGSWLWRTFDAAGGVLAQGLAATRKQAAALVIRQIVTSRAPNAPRSHISAKAA